MTRWDDVRNLKDAAKTRLEESELQAVAQTLSDGAEAVARRGGLTNKEGEISKVKVAKSALRPHKTALRLLGATAQEVQARRAASREDDGDDG